ncbi:MAG: hypothetical protein V4644_01610 [Patescibacteria group bacterium]
MEKEYALALSRSIEEGTDEKILVEGLMKHLKAEGRTKLLGGILRELKLLQSAGEKRSSVIEVASEGEVLAALAAAKLAGIEVEETVINPSLIKGWRIRSKGTLTDRSAKQALVDLYQKITN